MSLSTLIDQDKHTAQDAQETHPKQHTMHPITRKALVSSAEEIQAYYNIPDNSTYNQILQL